MTKIQETISALYRAKEKLDNAINENVFVYEELERSIKQLKSYSSIPDLEDSLDEKLFQESQDNLENGIIDDYHQDNCAGCANCEK